MSKRYTKFKSNYLMRSEHQQTDSGRIMERDWVTTNGMSVLRFGSGRRIWYNSGNFVFTTSNIPTYHKKHKLTAETKEWEWDDVANADGTTNEVKPSFNTNDIRDYAYYGSCVELIRATIEEVVADFPGRLISTNERVQSSSGTYVADINRRPYFIPSESTTSYESYTNDWFLYSNGKWIGPLTKMTNEQQGKIDGKLYEVYHDLSDNQVKRLLQYDNGNKYFESYGIATDQFNTIYYYDGKYYKYDYSKSDFSEYKVTEGDGVIDGFVLQNQFNIDLHHKMVKLGEYDNQMRFMAQSWTNYCVLEGNDDGKTPQMVVVSEFTTKNENGDDVKYGIGTPFTYEEYKKLTLDEKENLRQNNSISSFIIEDGFFDKKCPSNNEGKVMKTIYISTYGGGDYKIEAYYISGEIVYIYKPERVEDVLNKSFTNKAIKIQPVKSYIDDYFASLTGFKKQLLRQDTKPYYSNRFITPIEQDFIWYYPERLYTWPSDDYCVDISSMAFSTFVERMYDMGQSFDELWSDNIYRSMTHEAIKNFDWTYSREYYEGDAQDNIDGGERMQKILRVMGRAFDDVKVYIDTIKQTINTSYDKIKNGPEALLSDNNNVKGIDVVSTISSDYDIDASISQDFLNGLVKTDWWYREEYNDNDNTIKYSALPKWYRNRHSEDIYSDVCDNEIMRRLSLSAKRIMKTKGTQQGIEMMMGLFGLGRGVDYDIEEEALYTADMIDYNECVDGTLDDDLSHKGDDWSSTDMVNWKEVDNHKKGDLAIEINVNKDLDKLYYSDPLSGTPMRSVILGRDYKTTSKDGDITSHLSSSYLVPYYDSDQLYDDNLVFQGKGGWGRMCKTDDKDPYDNYFDYQETLSYLHVAGTIGDMLSVSANVVDANTIYYIVNLDDYTEYDEKPPMDIENGITMSHFFILINPYEPHKFYSWKNIVVKTTLDEDGKLQMVDQKLFETKFGSTEADRDWFYDGDCLDVIDKGNTEKILGTYKYAFKKMQYLDNIFSTNVANNPHVGYGKYDDGQTFLEYMKLPFKHLLDNQNLLGNSSLLSLANKYRFDDIDTNAPEPDKIKIMNTRVNDENGRTDFVRYFYIGDDSSDSYMNRSGYVLGEENDDVTNGSGYDDVVINEPKSVDGYEPAEINELKKGTKGTWNSEFVDTYDDVDKKWYINTKVITIKYIKTTNDGNLDINPLFSRYFKSIIMPYLMQVIPSTTILKLIDFA